MSITHTIRKDGKGRTAEVRLTPIKAIRCQCLECVGFSALEVKECQNMLCSLYPFRMGKAHAGRRSSRDLEGLQKAIKGQISRDTRRGKGNIAETINDAQNGLNIGV